MKVRNELSANKIIGINEINNYLQKNYNLDQTREKILIKTRQYAKRQANGLEVTCQIGKGLHQMRSKNI